MHWLWNMRMDMPSKVHHNRPERRPMVSRTLLRTILLLPFLRNSRYNGYNQPVDKTHQPNTIRRQSSHTYRTIPAGAPGHYKELLWKTLLYQASRNAFTAKSH